MRVERNLGQPARRLAAILAIGIALAGCVPPGGSSNPDGCAELLADARGYVQDGQTTDGKLDWTIDEMAYRCPDEYEVFVDEVSRAANFYAEPEPAQEVVSGPTGAIAWSDAVNYAGTTQYVCGPLVNSGTDQNDVFLNLGLGYPDAGRFTIVLWDVGGVESIPEGTTLCVTGPITLYEGVAQVELSDVGAVEVWG